MQTFKDILNTSITTNVQNNTAMSVTRQVLTNDVTPIAFDMVNIHNEYFCPISEYYGNWAKQEGLQAFPKG